jgi:hypothetical protein
LTIRKVTGVLAETPCSAAIFVRLIGTAIEPPVLSVVE